MRLTVVITYALLFLTSCSEKREYTRPFRRDITVSLYASANVKAKSQYTVLSTVPGVVKEVNVEPGDMVKAGDILFVLEDKEAKLLAANAREVLDYASLKRQKDFGQYQNALLQLAAAKNKFEIDSTLYDRQKKLWEQNVGTRIEFDQRQLTFNTSKISLDVAANQLLQIKKQLKSEEELSKINYRLSQTRQSDYLIRTEIDGKVFDVITHKGELANPQVPLCVIGSSDQFYLEMNVDERDIVKVRMAQRVEIVMDSYKGQIFEGKISKIYPIMNERSRTFKIEAIFVIPPPELYPNLTAEVNIIVDIKKKAVLIPRSYLSPDNYVTLAGDQKKKVITGVQDEMNVEILKGVDTGDIIYKPK